MRARTLVAAGLLVLSGAVQPADASTGAKLLQMCEHDASGSGECSWYISGVYNTFAIVALVEEGWENPVCFPDGVDDQQRALVVRAFLRENLFRLHEPAPVLVALALEAAFPCPWVKYQ